MLETERELFIDTLQELLAIERALEEYHAGFSKTATDEELADYFTVHAETTTEQIGRLETIVEGLENVEEAPQESAILSAIVDEHDDQVADIPDPNLADRVTVEAGRGIERLELTKLETLHSLADRLDLQPEVREPLGTTKTEVENGLERLQEWSNLPA